MEKEREQQVYLARLAEQAERYDGIQFRYYICSHFLIFFSLEFSYFYAFFSVFCTVLILDSRASGLGVVKVVKLVVFFYFVFC